MNPKFKEVSELETRIDRAKEILKFIIGKCEDEGIHDNDLERIYKVLDSGAKCAGMYKTKELGG